MNLRRSGAEGSLLLTALSGGFSLTDCESDTQFWLSSEPDDKVFLVHPAACPEYPEDATESRGNHAPHVASISGPEDLEDLPDDGYQSPWTYPAQVRLPMEHWEVIVAFAHTRNARDAALLEQAAVLDGASLGPVIEARLVRVLERLAREVVAAPPLTPDSSDPALIPEPMPNTAHAGMLRDVVRLVRRTRALGISVDSWVD